jgi:hypothetical protein
MRRSGRRKGARIRNRKGPFGSCCPGCHVLVALRGHVVLIGADGEQRRDTRAAQRHRGAVETAAPPQNGESSAGGSTGPNTAPSDKHEQRGPRTGDLSSLDETAAPRPKGATLIKPASHAGWLIGRQSGRWVRRNPAFTPSHKPNVTNNLAGRVRLEFCESQVRRVAPSETRFHARAYMGFRHGFVTPSVPTGEALIRAGDVGFMTASVDTRHKAAAARVIAYREESRPAARPEEATVCARDTSAVPARPLARRRGRNALTPR